MLQKQGPAKTGVPDRRELEASPGYPSPERLAAGPVAVIECVEEIPCNPCEAACPYGAIEIGRPITNLPRLHADRCRGCGRCLPACPGLAIFLVDKTYSQEEALVTFPYEYLPRPVAGSRVPAVNREGIVVTEGRVVRVSTPPHANGTVLVTLAVPREWADEVRGFKWWKGGDEQWLKNRT